MELQDKMLKYRSIILYIFFVITTASFTITQSLAASFVESGKLVGEGHIVAIVDKDPITSQELKWRMLQIRQMLPNNLPKGLSEEKIRRRTLEIMIDEQIELNYAHELGLTATEEEVEAAINEVAKNRKISPGELLDKWIASGAPGSEFKQEIKRQLLLSKLKQKVLRDIVRITPDQITNFISQHRHEKELQLEIQHILIPISTDKEKATQNVIGLFHSGHTFDSLVIQFSKAPDVSRHGYMGWRYVSTLPLELQKILLGVNVGDVAPPIETPLGVEIILIKNRREVESPFADQTQKKLQVIELSRSSSGDAKAKLEDIREKVLSGKISFSDALKETSEQEYNIFDERWVNVSELPTTIANAVRSLGSNGISQVVADEDNYYLIKVLGSRKQSLPITQQQSIATQMIMDKQGEQRFANWLTSRRMKSYIKVIDSDV
ncbi:peptidylprolyl isomerase [Candidatus Ichthyocystis sparus]|uniref:peptidylprolyl isomerase n=1 Tax=Candidatus Ichthyocystis sparus TaxID=1561004 RepID=UPI000B82BD58|nr:peptidylprolyl isomerase [Candidatus Ichthyocystis sparus]